MSTPQVIGAVMLFVFVAGLFIYTAKDMGVFEAIKAWAFALSATVFVIVATALLNG